MAEARGHAMVVVDAFLSGGQRGFKGVDFHIGQCTFVGLGVGAVTARDARDGYPVVGSPAGRSARHV